MKIQRTIFTFQLSERENPGLDIGVHLTLNCEWENIKWGPLTEYPVIPDKKNRDLRPVKKHIC